MERLSAPVLQLFAAVDTLTDWETAREKATLTGGQRATSGLQRWLVRLHIVSLYLQRLPGLRGKLLEETEKRIACRCPRDVDAVEHLRRLQGRGGGESRNELTSRKKEDALQVRQQEELAEITAAVDDAVEALTQKLQETAKEICRYDVTLPPLLSRAPVRGVLQPRPRHFGGKGREPSFLQCCTVAARMSLVSLLVLCLIT